MMMRFGFNVWIECSRQYCVRHMLNILCLQFYLIVGVKQRQPTQHIVYIENDTNLQFIEIVMFMFIYLKMSPMRLLSKRHTT